MGLFTKAELAKKPKAELLELIEKHSVEIDEDANVAEMRAALLEVEDVEEDDEEDDEEEDEEDDLELPEEDEVDEAPPTPSGKSTTAAKKTKYSEGEGILGAKEVATQVGTDAKSLRQFFRSGKSTFEAVGAGGRYEFTSADVPKIKAEFDAWKAGKPGRGRGAGEGGTTTRSRGRAATAEVIEEVEEIEELEDLEELDEDDLELEE